MCVVKNYLVTAAEAKAAFCSFATWAKEDAATSNGGWGKEERKKGKRQRGGREEGQN